MKNLINLLLILIAIVLFGMRIAKSVQFKQNVSGYLKRAADANTIELAHEELTKVLTYLEENDMTTGYTSMFWKTPDEDIDFWYRNLKASQKELEQLNATSALERTNVLIKLRETLVDTGESTKVTIPDGLAVYPHNKRWALLMLVATISGTWGLMAIVAELDKKHKAQMADQNTPGSA
jgi:hypothetical protein